MTIFLIWFVVTYIVVSYIFGCGYLVGSVSKLDDQSSMSSPKKNEILRRWAFSRGVRGVIGVSAPTGILIAWGTAEWIMDWDIFLICLLSVVASVAAVKFGPKAPYEDAFFGPEDLDERVRNLLGDEMQKLLGRVGAFKNKATNDSPYREADAMNELEEWLKNRIQTMPYHWE